MKTSNTSVTNRVLAMKFAMEFILIYPLYTIMFGDRGGVSAAGVGLIIATWFTLSVAFEVPTGVIADKIPRKFVLFGSILSKLLGLVFWLAMPTFAGYMAGAFLFALSSSLESGAMQAYLYESLGDKSKINFNKIWARVSAMVMISYTIAYVLASIIGVRYSLLLILSISSCIVALMICLLLPTDKLTTPIELEERPKILKSAVGHIIRSKPLFKLLISALIVVVLGEVLIQYYSLYYNQIGVETRYVPLILALGNVIGAVLFWTLHSWEKFLDKQKLLLMIVMTTLLIASFSGDIIFACAGMLLYIRFIRVLQVQFESNIQHLSNDEARATISSIAIFVPKLIASAIIILIGILAVDNIIVRPFQLAIVALSLLFITVHLAVRYKQKVNVS